MCLESFDKVLAFDKVHFQKFVQMRLLYAAYDFQELPVHILDVLPAAGDIVGRIVFSFRSPADPPDIELEGILESRNLTVYLDIIQTFKMLDARGQIPDLAIEYSGFILEGQGIVGLACLGLHGLFVFTEIDFGDIVT
jgi:hypothetical protein